MYCRVGIEVNIKVRKVDTKKKKLCDLCPCGNLWIPYLTRRKCDLLFALVCEIVFGGWSAFGQDSLFGWLHRVVIVV